MTDIVLDVKNLSIRYKDAAEPVVKDLSFQIRRGEILGLRGHSGKGKSTVVWALTELLQEYNAVAEGDIRIHGKLLHYDFGEEPRRARTFTWRELALVPQSSMSAFNPVYTIRRTMLETMSACGFEGAKEEKEARLHEICRMVRLDPEILSSYPHELSGGMKQRAAIGLAIMFNPAVLILDEATTGLDILIQAQVLGTILDLRNRYKMTILFISHDRQLAEHFCDRQIEL